jgi:hypothetical protein
MKSDHANISRLMFRPTRRRGYVIDLETDTDGHFALAEGIATAVVEISRTKGDCMPHDLRDKGFSPEEIGR